MGARHQRQRGFRGRAASAWTRRFEIGSITESFTAVMLLKL
jgi:CubicO group peptidase (beta-lactamase class C family)